MDDVVDLASYSSAPIGTPVAGETFDGEIVQVPHPHIKLKEAEGGLKESPLAKVEQHLREKLLMNTKEMLRELIDAVTPETAVHALRIMESISKNTRTLAAELGMGTLLDGSRKRRLVGSNSGLGAITAAAPNYTADFDSALSSGLGGTDLETFGAGFVQQLGATIESFTPMIGQCHQPKKCWL